MPRPLNARTRSRQPKTPHQETLRPERSLPPVIRLPSRQDRSGLAESPFRRHRDRPARPAANRYRRLRPDPSEVPFPAAEPDLPGPGPEAAQRLDRQAADALQVVLDQAAQRLPVAGLPIEAAEAEGPIVGDRVAEEGGVAGATEKNSSRWTFPPIRPRTHQFRRE